KNEECRKWIREAQALDSSEPSAFLLEAELLLREGARAQARSVIQQLLKTHPGLPQAIELSKRIP
ncbi:MAG: hypothetical protein ACRD1R_03565, partial [Acidobacteriota bacterium]